MKSFYEKNKSRVGGCGEDGRSFNVGMGLRHGCVMSPWLYILLMDGAVREWKARIMNADVCLNKEMLIGVEFAVYCLRIMQC